MRKESRFNQILALVAVAATIFVMLFSFEYIVDNVHHHCVGENCPICHEIKQCESNIRTIGAGVVLACVCVQIFSFVAKITATGVSHQIVASLISQKVRMDN